ncbi:NAD(P)-dependent oxidoreductase [Alteromonas ponticola]|uniref:NAD(P)-dependent oxidoreductase n=1 Tax=Alteromonas aquimaris TaxID=2998417 RepID=A0ABT3P6X5_9ALTE|nr:NAD(P)-dependent oxidoreductase [Alteromonas aquimaris]MCW8108523.1 NAD(P)-dependent oxidoreductase [Alteromonas aquimaris]
MNTSKVSFVGLGVMGFPMAGHLAAAGHEVTVFNRTEAKAQEWARSHPGKVAKSLDDAANGQDIVFMCVGDDKDVVAVASQLMANMKEGAILVDHTTASAEVARNMHSKAKECRLGFIDAPVSGGQAGAENGQLTIMCGGEQEHFARVEPVMACYSRHSQLLGDCGSGQLAKMMNQICIAGIVQGLAEALHFGQQAGLDCEQVINVISKGAAQSWQMENRAHTMLKGEYEFGFAVDWMRKDLAIALNEARRNGSTLALTALVDQYYADVQKLGGNRWDTSSLLTRLNKK